MRCGSFRKSDTASKLCCSSADRTPSGTCFGRLSMTTLARFRNGSTRQAEGYRLGRRRRAITLSNLCSSSADRPTCSATCRHHAPFAEATNFAPALRLMPTTLTSLPPRRATAIAGSPRTLVIRNGEEISGNGNVVGVRARSVSSVSDRAMPLYRNPSALRNRPARIPLSIRCFPWMCIRSTNQP